MKNQDGYKRISVYKNFVISKCVEKRISNKYTQRQVADFLNVSDRNISAFENGRNDSLSILVGYDMLFGGIL